MAQETGAYFPQSPDLVRWRKSSYSGYNGNCVELADLGGGVTGVRDSKDPDGPVLRFTPAEWAAFTAGVKAGDHDAPSRLAAVPDHMRPIELQDHPLRGRRHRTSP